MILVSLLGLGIVCLLLLRLNAPVIIANWVKTGIGWLGRAGEVELWWKIQNRKMSVRLKTIYNQQIVPFLMHKFVYANIDQVPKIEKIVVKCAVGDLAQNAKGLEVAMNDLALITGQKPNKTGEVAVKARTKHSMSNYRMNDGKPLGLVVTLRGNVMYSFLDRLINLGLPRTFDLQGATPSFFDRNGNYRIRIHEQSMFPEDRYDAIGKLKGVNVCITTSAKTNEETQNLLGLMGMPLGDHTAMEEEVEE